jgi:putative Mn2+ efflux pump MntP
MGIIDLLLIAVGLSMDAFAVAAANGIAMRDLRLRHSVMTAAAFGFFQGLMPAAGYFLGTGFERYISAYAHWIALILLAAIGGKMIYEGTRRDGESENRERRFSLRLLLAQAVATSIDALMAGVTFAAVGVSVLYAVTVIAVTTFCISLAGVYAGKRFGAALESGAELLGGGILALIGLKIFIERII